MKHVYLLMEYMPNPSGEDDGDNVRGVFDTKEAAIEFAKSKKPNSWHEYWVNEMELNNGSGWPEPKTVWSWDQ